MSFSAVAEYATGEEAVPQVVVSLLCEPATFTLTVRPAGLNVQIDSLQQPAEGGVAEFAVTETPPSDGIFLFASPAIFSLTGMATGAARAEVSEGAIFALSGQDAGIGFAVEPATFALSLNDATFREYAQSDAATFTLILQSSELAWQHDAAIYALTGYAALSRGAFLAETAIYALTGIATFANVDLSTTLPNAEGAVAEFAVTEFPSTIGFGVYAGVATFSLSVMPTLFMIDERLEPAAFVLTGGEANVGWRHDGATYTLTGQPAAFSPALAADAAVYALTLFDAQIMWASGAANFVWTVNDATLNPFLNAETGTFALVLQGVFVGIRAEPGSFVLTGMDAAVSIRILAEHATFSLAAQNAELLNIFKMYPETGIFTLTGQDAGRAYGLGPEPGIFTLTGLAAFTTADRLGPATYALTGFGSGFDLALKLATGMFTLIGWNVVDALGPSGDHIFLIEAQYHDGTEVKTAHFATSDWTSAPGDTPPNQYYASRIGDPGNFQRTLFSQGETRGRSTIGSGDVKINSGDPGNGDLIDDLLDHGWSGREIKIKALPRGAQSLAAASTLFVGRSDRLTATRPLDEFSLRIADRLADLEKPLLTTLFAGTTTSTAPTAEGNADLKGQIKQRVYGSPKEVPLQPANPYDLIYLVSNGPLVSVQVYDGGVPLDYVGDYASVAALRSATIGTGSTQNYATCLALGLVRLDDTPEFTLTADPVEGATPADRTAAQIAKRMLLDYGIPSNEIITGAFDALDDINDAPCSYWIPDDRTALIAIQDVLDSVGGWMVPGREGSFSVGRLDDPEVSTTGLIFDVEEQSIGSSLDRVDGEIPAYRITVQYARVNTVQNDSALAGAVSAERRAYLASEWRSVVAEDISIKTKHLNAREIVVTTFFDDESDAQAEADRLLDLYKVERERYDVTLSLADAWAGDVGLAMTLVHPRLGFADGKPFAILGRVDNYEAEKIRFSLWG